jgi:hypothetical protein
MRRLSSPEAFRILSAADLQFGHVTGFIARDLVIGQLPAGFSVLWLATVPTLVTFKFDVRKIDFDACLFPGLTTVPVCIGDRPRCQLLPFDRNPGKRVDGDGAVSQQSVSFRTIHRISLTEITARFRGPELGKVLGDGGIRAAQWGLDTPTRVPRGRARLLTRPRAWFGHSGQSDAAQGFSLPVPVP